MARITRRSVVVGGLSLPFLAPSALAARAAGELRFGLSSYPPSLSPWSNTGTAALTVKLQIFRGLLGYSAAGTLRPELAESWQRDGDAAWVFKLREAQFHNGKPVTSEDVKWTFEQVAAEASTALFKTEFQGVEKIETPDPRTVRVVMKRPTVTLPLWCASPHLPIIAKGSTDGGALGVGAGPYKIKAQERGVSIDLEAFPGFFKKGKPELKTVRMIVYADENLRVAALKAGDVDLIEYVPWQHMKSIEADSKLKLDSANGPFMLLGFNGQTGPFKDPRLRLATAYAIRREEIVQAAFYGRGTPLQSIPITPGTDYYDEGRAKTWRYDPDKAKALLKEAGVPNGFSCTLLSTAQYGMHKSTAEVVQQHLGEIGIKVALNLPDWATRVALGGKGQYEFCVQGTTADNNDPDGLAQILDGELPANISRSFGLPTPKIHELFVAGRAEFDTAKRKAIYAEIEKIALADAPIVGLAWRSQGYGMAKDVVGFKSLSGSLNFYSAYTLEDTKYA